MSLTVIRFSDLSLLKGQLNGDKLEVAGYFTGSGNQGNGTPAPSGDYVTVTDDTGTIRLEIPSAWTDFNGEVWHSDWGGLEFDAPSITASTNLSDFYDFRAPGVFFSASDRLGEIGGFIQLLDGVRGWYESDCKLDKTLFHHDYGEGDWYDQYFEGKFDVWKDCGPDKTNVLILAARPKANPTAYLILVDIRFSTDADLEYLAKILATFSVIKSF
jgi:serine protease Do